MNAKWAACVAVLTAAHVAAVAPPAVDPTWRAERDRLLAEMDKAQAAGKYGEAVEFAERALVLTRKLRGEVHSETASGIGTVAEALELAGRFEFAVARRQEWLAVWNKRPGAKAWQRFQVEAALAFARKAEGMKAEERKRLMAALQQEEVAVRLYQQGKAKACGKACEEVLKEYEALLGSETLQGAHVSHLQSQARLAVQDLRGAKAPLEKAVAIRRRLMTVPHPHYAESLNNLGGVLRELEGDLLGARKCHEEALAVRREALRRGHPDIGQSLRNLALVLRELREFAGARKCLEEALAIRRAALREGHSLIADSLSDLGGVLHDMRKYEEAKTCYAEAVAICRRATSGDDTVLAMTLGNLGAVLHDMEDHVGAKACLGEALAIFRLALPKEDPLIAQALNNLAGILVDLREYAAARKCHDEALTIRRAGPPRGQSLNNLGNLLHALQDHAGAMECFREALKIFRGSLPKDHLDTAQCLSNMGVVLHGIEDNAGAMRCHEEALAILRGRLPVGDPLIAKSLSNLGVVLHDMGEFARARKLLEEALTIYRKELPAGHPRIADVLGNVGNALFLQGDYAGARKCLAESLAINRRALHEGHPRIAHCQFRLIRVKWLNNESKLDDVRTIAEALTVMHADAHRQAVCQAESIQLSTHADLAPFSSILLSIVPTDQPNQASGAYASLLRYKGAVTTRQRWARQARAPKDAATDRLLGELRTVDSQLLNLSASARPGAERAVRELARQRLDLERLLADASPQYRRFIEQSNVNPDDVRKSLPRSTALIDFFEYTHGTPPLVAGADPDFERRFTAFVVRPDGVRMVPLGPADPIEKAVERWRATHGTGRFPAKGDADPGDELRTLIWEPLAKHLDGVKTVLYSPDGALNGLPLAALPGKEKGKYLIHDHAFAVVPVPQLLPEILRPRPKAKPSALLVGGIDFGAGPAPKNPGRDVPHYRGLPGTGSEVNDLRSQFEDAFGAPAPVVLRKDRATRAAVVERLNDFRFVHLATHGYFAEPTPHPEAVALRGLRDFQMRDDAVRPHPGLLSGLVFAGVNRPDRKPAEVLLTALEAAELKLDNVELLVLSACDTGRGRVAGGEGVLGLQRAFQIAGVGTTVTSLWKVDDAATHLLMREFYRQVWDAEMPVARAEALRQAQLWMLDNATRGGLKVPEGERRVSPSFWAAFVLSGDWR